MKPRAPRLVLTLTLALLAVPFAARELLAAPPALDERIDIQLQGAAAGDVFKSFGQLTGMEAVVDPALRGQISIVLEHVRVRTALDAACDSLYCRWEIQPGPPPKLVVSALPGRNPKPAKTVPTDPIDLKVTKAEVRDLLKTFGEMVSAEVDLDPTLAGKVTLDLVNTPWNEALDTVCQQVGCDWSFSQGEKKVLKFTAKAGRKNP
jgi:type II secretory pathway component GspD/PulD (secretin)